MEPIYIYIHIYIYLSLSLFMGHASDFCVCDIHKRPIMPRLHQLSGFLGSDLGGQHPVQRKHPRSASCYVASSGVGFRVGCRLKFWGLVHQPDDGSCPES